MADTEKFIVLPLDRGLSAAVTILPGSDEIWEGTKIALGQLLLSRLLKIL